MIRVSNRKCIRHLAKKSLRASKTRNAIAVLAIALTTVLFTSLFTIAMSINDSFQEANFRQAGGYSHGGFKYLTEEQFQTLKEDPLISEWGLRRFIGMPAEAPFNKNHVEIGYSDSNQAHWMYCDPVEGRLPREGTDEAATDLEVLGLLGVTPKLGETFTVDFLVDGVETTQTFTLCGWWEKDKAITANHILIPESRVEAVLQELQIPSPSRDGMTGSYNLDVMFQNAAHIEERLNRILEEHGYQSEGPGEALPYIDIGVNWGYTGAQLSDSVDPATAAAIGGMLLLIILTGYLIIYNVFRISVVGEIRFYGLLKTIGTTGKQLKHIIRLQAFFLSILGIPLGLAGGWIIGSRLTPMILQQLNGVVMDVVSMNPLIFLFSAAFALVTVLISCSRPGRMAARISPVEAVRYTESNASKKTVKKGRKGVSVPGMALANMGRSKSKTVITVLSLALAVVLLNGTVMFTNGFDMDKYLRNFSVSDFVVADAGYFQTGTVFSADTALSETMIERIRAQGGISDGGKVYGKTGTVQEFITEDWFRERESRWNSPETIDAILEGLERTADGKVAVSAQLSGMEPYALNRLSVLEGDLNKLLEPGGRYIAAVYSEDDYGNPEMNSHWAKLGDTVTLRYDTQEIDYEVAALVKVPYALSYRYYGEDAFVLNDQTFLRDTGTASVMAYAFDTTEQENPRMEKFLSEETAGENAQYDYESKATYQAEFESFRSMFLILGGVLSFIVGLIGILNYINAILTGILTRRREFAMLQSIGMTGKQLKAMLVFEGLIYALSAVVFAFFLSLLEGPLASTALSSMFWFFTYRLTLTPILCAAPVFALLGCIVPLIVYRIVSGQTIVERLRDAEN